MLALVSCFSMLHDVAQTVVSKRACFGVRVRVRVRVSPASLASVAHMSRASAAPHHASHALHDACACAAQPTSSTLNLRANIHQGHLGQRAPDELGGTHHQASRDGLRPGREPLSDPLMAVNSIFVFSSARPMRRWDLSACK